MSTSVTSPTFPASWDTITSVEYKGGSLWIWIQTWTLLGITAGVVVAQLNSSSISAKPRKFHRPLLNYTLPIPQAKWLQLEEISTNGTKGNLSRGITRRFHSWEQGLLAELFGRQQLRHCHRTINFTSGRSFPSPAANSTSLRSTLLRHSFPEQLVHVHCPLLQTRERSPSGHIFHVQPETAPQKP